MNIAITGGTGFLGSLLTEHLLSKGHYVYILTRNSEGRQNKDRLEHVEWLTENAHPEKELQNIDAFINLAGASINQRWTPSAKRKILQSRIEATQETYRIMNALDPTPSVLINASAVGYYGTSKTEVFTEENGPAEQNFLQKVCDRWEQEAIKAENLGVRTVRARFGIILSTEEGALPRMMLPYKLFAGGPVGSGKQWFSWIHVKDVINMIEFALENNHASGPMNVTAPHPYRMKDFGKELGKVMNRPHWAPAPAFALKTALGEMSVLILEGQKVLPKQAEAWGYSFSYPELRPALEDIVGK
ncbi:TIGR01777 family oxidoreductase [Bacillus sp. FJAT-44742]|uniref:TIGR01777 family oxidoreductase n=1 Tax=Bacillus sp. FJAT-44742 TaxID=2014005 RepID=UPI000C239605|nr:TIGR01777 family oxidoreductase [Bacillus sp. FJAT-44742]